jgi:hypothetical protein
MKLLIFPGGGNPSHREYKDAYDLLAENAPRYGYDEVDISLRWPGQFTENERADDALTFDGAVDAASSYLSQHEQEKERFDIVSRSFGTLVAARSAIGDQPAKLRKLIFWGVPPYWLFWRRWKRDLEANRKMGLRKGIRIEESFFSSLVPFEETIPELPYPAVVATGTNDEVAQPAFLKYLASLVSEEQDIDFRVVDDAPHVVDSDSPADVRKGYLEALFT